MTKQDKLVLRTMLREVAAVLTAPLTFQQIHKCLAPADGLGLTGEQMLRRCLCTLIRTRQINYCNKTYQA